ncbi:hypothetical protein BDF14DRAFT_1719949 [Spinellus fusiger]|nr:hypothetical protein BDF14DRAFT_1719949 [Spinellus fusiger]
MIQKMKDRELDLSIALTEGLVAGNAKQQDWYNIVGTYVDVPLCWGISAGKESKHNSIDTLHQTNVAISRFGSGSHIMAYVLAEQQGWLSANIDKEHFQFNVLHDFKSMRDAVNDTSSDFFMWEIFTTKPYYDSGEVKNIGQITPPWPAFTFAAHVEMQSRPQDTKNVLKAIQKATVLFMDQKENESVQYIMKHLEYKEEDIRQWFKTVSYAKDLSSVSSHALEVVGSSLIKAGIINSPAPSPEALCDLDVATLYSDK